MSRLRHIGLRRVWCGRAPRRVRPPAVGTLVAIPRPNHLPGVLAVRSMPVRPTVAPPAQRRAPVVGIALRATGYRPASWSGAGTCHLFRPASVRRPSAPRFVPREIGTKIGSRSCSSAVETLPRVLRTLGRRFDRRRRDETLRPRQIEHVLAHAGARCLVTTGDLLARHPPGSRLHRCFLDASAMRLAASPSPRSRGWERRGPHRLHVRIHRPPERRGRQSRATSGP